MRDVDKRHTTLLRADPREQMEIRPAGTIKYKTIKILKEELFRDRPNVNITDNMVRVTLTCSRNEWREVKKHLKNANNTTNCR